MTSYLGGGLASLDRWEGLKEWHRRHQDLLGGSSSDSVIEGCGNQYQSSLLNIGIGRSQLQSKDFTQKQDDFQVVDVISSDALKPDLSVIQEVDEDSRSKDGDQDELKSKKGLPLIQKAVSAQNKEHEVSVAIKTSDPKCNKFNELPSDKSQGNTKKITKRPFLRKGQGLVRYNLQPGDLKNPYRNTHSTKPSEEKHTAPIRHSRFAIKCRKPSIASGQTSQNRPGNKLTKAPDLSAPMQRLVLSLPSQKLNSAESGTWSQVFGVDTDSNSNTIQVTGNELKMQKPQIGHSEMSKESHLSEAKRVKNVMSPRRKVNVCRKQDSSPEEDQESLAAYLDLEQHVGNASFCSTSSKVDRLVTKSSSPSIHQSNPDAITQLKQLSPIKTGRKFFYTGQDGGNSREDRHSMWSTTDLENLVKARARRSGSLIKARSEATNSSNQIALSSNKTCSPEGLEDVGTRSSHQGIKATSLEPHFVDWMAETLGPSRKPHLMKTMPGIDLDSSLVRNALAPILHVSSEESDSDDESSTSMCSSVDDSEQDFCVNNSVKTPTKPNGEVSSKLQGPQDIQSVPHKPFQFSDNVSLEEINHQIETHLSELRNEIETLQAAKSKTQKYIASLEKKVQDLEQNMALDARSFNKRLESEREAASKRLTEVETKFLKEKQALQRTIREERKKAPDPISHQELLRLKQEVAQWEEKWRADRAKARGLESNLRIQLTNLRKENEKLKEENSKLMREKEAAVSTAKARSASNTRVINSIAQHLGNSKPKVSVVREESTKLRKGTTSSAYNLKPLPKTKTTKDQRPVATIENFPELPRTNNEWSSDEEIDLGKDSSEEDDIDETEGMQHVKSSSDIVQMESEPSQAQKVVPRMQISQYETIDLEATQAKYDAIFGKSGLSDLPSVSSEEVTRANRAKSAQVPLHHDPEHHGSSITQAEKFVKSIQHADGKVEQIKGNGTRIITYPDGTWERHGFDGSVMTVPLSGWPVHISYFNGDKLEKLSDGTTRYFYAKTNVWQTTYPDGHEELRYPSGHVEYKDQNGSVKVLLPSTNENSKKNTSSTLNEPSTTEISVEKLPNGDTLILLPTGERELHTKQFMKKDFLDGTVRFLYKDGSQETRYPSGRIRVKDAQGNLIKDTMQSAE